MKKSAIINEIRKRGSEYLSTTELRNYLDYFDAVLPDPVSKDLASDILNILNTSTDPLREIRVLLEEEKIGDVVPGWESITLGDVFGLSSALDDSQDALQSVADAADTLKRIADVTVKTLEAQVEALRGESKLKGKQIKALVSQFEQLLDSATGLIKNISDTGVYVLPQIESVDIPLFVRKEILSVAGIEDERIERERIVRSRTSDNRYVYKRIKPKYYRKPSFKNFVNDVIASFDDSKDPYRLQTDQPIIGISAVVAADDVFVFLVLAILVAAILYGPKKAQNNANRFYELVSDAINVAESRGRLSNADKLSIKQRGQLFIKQVKSLIESEANSYASLFKWAIDSLNVLNASLGASGTSYTLKDITLEGEVVPTDEQTDYQIQNYQGYSWADLSISISGSSIVEVLVNGVRYWIDIVENKDLGIKVPLYSNLPTVTAIGNDIIDGAGNIIETYNRLGTTIQLGSNLYSSTNRITVNLYQPRPGDSVETLDVEPLEAIELFALRPNRVFGAAQVDLNDGFPYYQRYSAKVGRSTVSGTDSIDLARFGDSLNVVDLKVYVDLPFDASDSFEAILVWDGKEYRPDRISGSLDRITLEFDNLSVRDSDFTAWLILSDVFVEEGYTYRVYSAPQIVRVLRKSGLLGAPLILSEDVATSVELLGNVSDAITRSINQFNDIYGDRGIKQADRQKKKVSYNLVVQKNPNAVLYALVDGKPRVLFEDTTFNPIVSIPLEFDWDGKDDSHDIVVYQSLDATVLKAARESETNEELLKKIGNHTSRAGRITVTIPANALESSSQPPDWVPFTVGGLLDLNYITESLIEPIKNMLRANTPTDPLGDFVEIAEAIVAKIKNIAEYANSLLDLINDIRAFLEFGGTGFYFLVVHTEELEGNSIESFKRTLQNTPAPPELANAKFVAGIQLLMLDMENVDWIKR